MSESRGLSQFRTDNHAKLALCCLNSNLFYWFVTVYSDCRHLNKREVDSFPINLTELESHGAASNLMLLAKELMDDLQKNSDERTMRFSHDTLTVQCIIPKHSKEIIDRIDHALSQYYGFSREQTDYVIDYDLKYRVGITGSEESSND